MARTSLPSARVSARGAEVGVEGGADEGAVDRLAVDALAVQRVRLGLDRVAGRARPHVSFGSRRIMVDMDDGRAGLAPGGDQRGDVRLRARIVARPPGRIVEARLHVDHEQRGIGWKVFHARIRMVAPDTIENKASCCNPPTFRYSKPDINHVFTRFGITL